MPCPVINMWNCHESKIHQFCLNCVIRWCLIIWCVHIELDHQRKVHLEISWFFDSERLQFLLNSRHSHLLRLRDLHKCVYGTTGCPIRYGHKFIWHFNDFVHKTVHILGVMSCCNDKSLDNCRNTINIIIALVSGYCMSRDDVVNWPKYGYWDNMLNAYWIQMFFLAFLF